MSTIAIMTILGMRKEDGIMTHGTYPGLERGRDYDTRNISWA
jgi:hypothetical protein